MLRGAALQSHRSSHGARHEPPHINSTPPALFFSLSFGRKGSGPQPHGSSATGGPGSIPPGSSCPIKPPTGHDAPPSPRRPGSQASSLTVTVSVALKALVPELTPRSAVVALRMADRFLTFSAFDRFWVRRPAVPVSQSPAAWWQHAGNSIMNTCRCRRDGGGGSMQATPS